MKLCTFVRPGGGALRSGLVLDGRVYDLAGLVKEFGREVPLVANCDYSYVLGILRTGRSAFESIKRLQDVLVRDKDRGFEFSFPEEETKLLAPVPKPNSIRDFMVFEKHLINATHTVASKKFPPAAWLSKLMYSATGRPLLKPPKAWYELPAYYKGAPDTVIGHGDPIIWPPYTEMLDYELEFGMYLMEGGVDISEKDAGSLIAGYTIFNDVSARDIQMKEMSTRMGPSKGKDFDSGNVMGPYLVTPDEVGDPYSLSAQALVNGEVWTDSSTTGMHFSFEEIIAYVSRSETLRAGDFFGSGTVAWGCGLELDRWIKPGDRITLKVEKLGELTNQVVRE